MKYLSERAVLSTLKKRWAVGIYSGNLSANKHAHTHTDRQTGRPPQELFFRVHTLFFKELQLN